MAGWRVGLLWVLMLCVADGQATKCPGMSIIKVLDLSKAFVSCPSSNMATEVKYHLSLNYSLIHTVELNKNSGSGPAGIWFSVNGSPHFEVQTNSSGLYSCRSEVLYPPPHKEDCHTTVVVVGEKQNLPATNQGAPLTNQSSPDGYLTVLEVALSVACGILLVYSLAITCVTFYLWRKLKKEEDDQSEYVNTKPREFKRT